MNEEQYQEFRDIIREIVKEEVSAFLKDQGFSRQLTAMVTEISDDNRECSLDLVDTTLNKILNKSGSTLKVGDTVTVSERYGSNYSNCYIAAKNGQDRETSVTVAEDMQKNKEDMENIINTKFSNVTSISVPTTGNFAYKRMYVDVEGSSYRINFD